MKHMLFLHSTGVATSFFHNDQIATRPFL